MATMDMAMVEKISKTKPHIHCCAIAGLLLSASSFAGEWRFNPSLGLTETYTDNIELKQIDKQSSLVSQFIIGADANFSSRKLQFSFNESITVVIPLSINPFREFLQEKAVLSLQKQNVAIFRYVYPYLKTW